MTPFSKLVIAESKEGFQAFSMTRPPRLLLSSSLFLILMLLCVVSALIYVPWRQTVIGQGEVAIFDPLDRPQTVDSQIKGRLIEVLVKEGEEVTEGQVLATLEDRDSKFLDPQQTERLRSQISALEEKKSAAFSTLEALDSQLLAIEASRSAKTDSAKMKIMQTEQKLEVERQMLVVGEQDLETARLQEERTRTLELAGLKSRRDLELVVQKRVEAEAKLQKMKGDLLLSGQDIQLAKLEVANIQAEANEKTQKTKESIAKAREGLADIDENIQKLESEFGALKVRRSLQTLTAPSDGQVVNLLKLGPGQLVKEGQTIAMVVPQSQTRGVELYLTGVDAPLVKPGLAVRLMFEGFPAVPFAGWDWASVGTFGGRVVTVDPVNSEGEKAGYRAWVMPDPREGEWPSKEKLRLGAKANGWLMLNKVPLYYELWRQLNAFPANPVNGDPENAKSKPVIRR